MIGNFGSFLRTSESEARDFEVLSRLDVLTAAVYWMCRSSQFLRIRFWNSFKFAVGTVSWNVPKHLHKSHLGRIEALEVSSLALGLLERRSGGMEIQLKLASNWIVK